MTIKEIIQYTIIAAEALSAFASLWYFKSLKNTYWKYFVWYCILIFANELFSLLVLDHFKEYRRYFFDVYAIPVQFLFLFWLYAQKSLQMPRFYILSTFIYIISFVPHFFYAERYSLINSMSYSIGCALLLVMSFFEFIQQIKSDQIIYFYYNKMFYINLGVILFYVGTMPFFAFMKQLYDYNHDWYFSYQAVALITTVILYLSFTASFIWGKPKS